MKTILFLFLVLASNTKAETLLKIQNWAGVDLRAAFDARAYVVPSGASSAEWKTAAATLELYRGETNIATVDLHDVAIVPDPTHDYLVTCTIDQGFNVDVVSTHKSSAGKWFTVGSTLGILFGGTSWLFRIVGKLRVATAEG